MDIFVYADILFLINFCMNFLVMYAAAKLFKKKFRKLRLILGAAFSSLTYCLVFPLTPGPFLNFLAGVLAIAAGMAISFAPMKAKAFMFMTLAVHVIAMAMGGCCAALYFLSKGGGFYALKSFPLWLLIAAAAVSYILIKAVYAKITKNIMKKQAFYEIKVIFMGKEARLVGMVDTGHSLTEPISRWPVIISEFAAVKNLLPDNIRLLFFEKAEDDITRVITDFEAGGLTTRIRLIPFKSIGERNGTLIGIRPDEVVIAHKSGEKHIKEVIIGIYNEALSGGKGEVNDYRALINPELLEDTL